MLRVIDFAKDTQDFCSLQGAMITPISLPTSAISGIYVSVYNTYKIGDTLLVFRKP
ncbi:MAG TPA: hypothetical protein VIZ65_09040 [Cellvibrionaceae bacterium]